MKDDAIAPVIAVMLILAAIVTFYSIWNAIYIPSMKESSEIEHIQNVETAFEHFSSDIDNAASSHQNHLAFSEPVQLGGGDILFNPIKSSGTLDVVQDRNQTRVSQSTIYNISFFYGTTPIEENGTLINFSYEPVGNFWQDQGYQWQYGYINVTKYGTLITPLSYDTMDNVTNATESGSLALFAKSFASVDYMPNQTEIPVYPTTSSEQPVVTSISPIAGPPAGGTPVIITGVGFTGATNVTFGSIPAIAFTVNGDNSITAVSPSDNETGLVDITVTTPYPGNTSFLNPPADQFTYTQVPIVTGVSPTAGPLAGNMSVTITGSGFTGATRVEFGSGYPAPSFTVNSDTSITVYSPQGGQTAPVDVIVTTPSGTSLPNPPADQFTYAKTPVMVVTSISPNVGPLAGGTQVIITGVGFTGANCVEFGGIANATGAMTVNSDTSITVYSPGPNGVSGDVTVTTPGGTSLPNPPADQFTYTSVPTVTGVSPTAGPLAGGTSVTITGFGFTGANNVKFGTIPNSTGNITVNSDTSITVVSPPADSSGPVDAVDVTVTTLSGTSKTSPADNFTYSEGLLPKPIHLPTSY
ncbi:MAG: IPT/TIG domain-containing protein, partial [Methanoregula sp.]